MLSSPGVRLAERILALCAAKGIQLKAVFEECGLDRSTFSRWRAGRTNPTTITMERVELALRTLGAPMRGKKRK
jgi:transcriptional regulator with XRE-family HTH domain